MLLDLSPLSVRVCNCIPLYQLFASNLTSAMELPHFPLLRDKWWGWQHLRAKILWPPLAGSGHKLAAATNRKPKKSGIFLVMEGYSEAEAA